MPLTTKDIREALLSGDVTKIAAENLTARAAASPAINTRAAYENSTALIISTDILDENEGYRESLPRRDEFSSLEEFAAILLKYAGQDKRAILNSHSVGFLGEDESSITQIAFKVDPSREGNWHFPLQNLIPTLSTLGYASAEIISCRAGVKIRRSDDFEPASPALESSSSLEKPMPVLLSSGKYPSLAATFLLELEEDYTPEIYDSLPETLPLAVRQTIASFATKIIRSPDTCYFSFGDRYFKKSGPKPESSDDLANFRVKAHLENDLQRFWGFCQAIFPEHEFECASLSIETESLLDEEAINLYKNRAAFIEAYRGKTANAKLYLEAGADWRYAISRNKQHNLLFLACDGADTDLPQTILGKYFDPTTDIEITTEAFLLSIAHGNMVSRMFLDRGLDVNCASHRGLRPLHQACGLGNLDFAIELLGRGATLDATTIAGMTALYFAVDNGHLDAVELLLMSGAYDGVEEVVSFLEDGCNANLSRFRAAKALFIGLATELIPTATELERKQLYRETLQHLLLCVNYQTTNPEKFSEQMELIKIRVRERFSEINPDSIIEDFLAAEEKPDEDLDFLRGLSSAPKPVHLAPFSSTPASQSRK